MAILDNATDLYCDFVKEEEWQEEYNHNWTTLKNFVAATNSAISDLQTMPNESDCIVATRFYQPPFNAVPSTGTPDTCVLLERDNGTLAYICYDSNGENTGSQDFIAGQCAILIDSSGCTLYYYNDVTGELCPINEPEIPKAELRAFLSNASASSVVLFNNVLTTIPYNVENPDTVNGYDPASGVYTVQNDGCYHVQGGAFVSNDNNIRVFTLGITVNGVIWAWSPRYVHESGGADSVIASAHLCRSFNAGDTIDIRASVLTVDGSSVPLGAQSTINRFLITQVE